VNAILPLELLRHRPLPALTTALLRDVVGATQATSIAWFVGGASARDILLTHIHDIDAARATADVDIGVAIQSWANHTQLRNALLASGHFAASASANATHRLTYRMAGSGERTWLDIVPFGGVQDGCGEIAWPPDQAVRMNVAGFQQALDAAVPVKVAAGLVVPLASLPAQAMLKLIAWQDRHAADRKDAIDLLFLMSKYAQAGNMDRLYGEEFALVERFGHDPDRAGAALLGREMAAVASEDVRARLLAIVAPHDPEPPILTHMLGYRATLFGTDTTEDITALFDAFRQTFYAAAT
jgi:predicted nucleotidyltransferase